jgi:hypothetical protein
MTIEDGHFRTNGKTIEPCCVDMRFFIHARISPNEYDGTSVPTYDIHEALNRNAPILAGSYCPSCGAKLEYVKKLEASQ